MHSIIKEKKFNLHNPLIKMIYRATVWMDADREAEAGPKDDRKMQFFFFRGLHCALREGNPATKSLIKQYCKRKLVFLFSLYHSI